MDLVERYREAWVAEKAKADADVATAARDKSVLPDHYWQDEYRARMRYQSAVKVIEALEEM